MILLLFIFDFFLFVLFVLFIYLFFISWFETTKPFKAVGKFLIVCVCLCDR